MSRPKRTSLDPSWFEAGAVGGQTGVTDEYFQVPGPDAVTLILDAFVSKLPEPDRSAVLACVMGQYSYSEGALLLEADLGYAPDKKTIWRWAQRGLLQLKRELLGTPWAGLFLADRVALDPDVVTLPSDTDTHEAQDGGTPNEDAE